VMSSLEGGILVKNLIGELKKDGRERETIKAFLSIFLDRNPVYVEQSKVIVSELLVSLKSLIISYHIKCRSHSRLSSTLSKEDQKKAADALKDDVLINEKILGGLCMVS